MIGGAVRHQIKRLAPPSVKSLIFRLRDTFAGPPIDEAVLADYRFLAEDGCHLRLNLVIPNLAAGLAFGGVLTGVDVFLQLIRKIAEKKPVDIRLILTEPDANTDTSLFADAVAKLQIEDHSCEILRISTPQSTITVRCNDVFITYNWWTTLNIRKLINLQAAYFGGRRKPIVYLIQEYEPHLFAFSSANMLAREAYDGHERLWGIFNSANLYQYFGLQGHSVERAFAFEPVINDKLRGYLPKVGQSTRRKQILIYGRPSVPRNCFPALIRGLKTWAGMPEFHDWQVISAGTAHRPVPLGDGRKVRSVGKLSLDDYAQTLLESAVGISLMASPHPSYPPLEMAHMGLRTVTNGYLGKDLSQFHGNIVSVDSIGVTALSEAIAQACRMAEWGNTADMTPNIEYLREDLYPFMPELAEAIVAEIS